MDCLTTPGAIRAFRPAQAPAVKNTRPQHGIDMSRALTHLGMISATLAWGFVELFALQRSRYQAWRGRAHAALASPGIPQARSARRRGRFLL